MSKADNISGSTLLDVRDLHTYFFVEGGPAKAVEGASLRIESGKTLGLVGESGCGKSVTSLALLRLVPPPGRIARGSIRFDGRDLLDLPHRDLRRLRGRRIAMVFQEPAASLNPVHTIGRQIREAIRAHQPVNRRTARRQAVELLARVQIPSPADRARDYPHQLSGGGIGLIGQIGRMF